MTLALGFLSAVLCLVDVTILNTNWLNRPRRKRPCPFYTITFYITAMDTTIQITHDLREALKMRKMSSSESYENVIWDLIEDNQALSEEAKRSIALAEMDINAGRVHKWEDVKKELDINV